MTPWLTLRNSLRQCATWLLIQLKSDLQEDFSFVFDLSSDEQQTNVENKHSKSLTYINEAANIS